MPRPSASCAPKSGEHIHTLPVPHQAWSDSLGLGNKMGGSISMSQKTILFELVTMSFDVFGDLAMIFILLIEMSCCFSQLPLNQSLDFALRT